MRGTRQEYGEKVLKKQEDAAYGAVLLIDLREAGG